MPKRKQQRFQFKKYHALLVAVVVGTGFAGLATILSNNADAAMANSLYSYDLRNVASASVANGAAANTAVNLNLKGSWSAQPEGVAFTGNLVDQQSVGWAKPSTGPTLYVAAQDSLAFGAAFTFQAPAAGTCFKDSSNMVQIGRFGDLMTQAKLQLSSCGKSKTATYIQCRIAGNSTRSSVAPVMSTMPLENGASYTATCTKGLNASGTTVVSLSVTKHDAVNGDYTVGNTFTTPATGIMRSTQYLSVANKYPLPTLAKNTDQFVGTISKVAFCKGSNQEVALFCLRTELPL